MKQVLSSPDVIASLVRSRRKPLPQPGQRVGRLVIGSELGYIVSGDQPRLLVRCSCDCGRSKFIYAQYLRKAKSCGCLVVEAAKARKMPQGAAVTDSPLYFIWASMRRRCGDPTNPAYKAYAGRGISVCLEWRISFRAFEAWAIAAGFKPGLSIDRIDNDGNYEPGNCRWATPQQQARNTRRNAIMSAFGEHKTVSEWAADSRCRVSAGLLYLRRQAGWTHEKAITTPPNANPATLTAFGETRTLKEWAADPRCAVSYKVLWQRLHINRMIPEVAIASGRRGKPKR